jgi:hypothetical protein
MMDFGSVYEAIIATIKDRQRRDRGIKPVTLGIHPSDWSLLVKEPIMEEIARDEFNTVEKTGSDTIVIMGVDIIKDPRAARFPIAIDPKERVERLAPSPKGAAIVAMWMNGQKYEPPFRFPI